MGRRTGGCLALGACLALAAVVGPPAGRAAAATPGTPPCTSKDVSISVVPGMPTMGRADLVVLVTDRGREACAVAGRPAVHLLGHDGSVRGAAVPAPPAGATRPLAVAPGETVSALLSGSDQPIGGATTCPSFDAYAVLVTPAGTGRTIAGPLVDCAGLSITPFVPGFNGMSTSGRVTGRAPSCQSPPTPTAPGAFVEIDAWSGHTLAGSVDVAASAVTEEPYVLVLAPGRYRMSAHDGASRVVVVRAGRTTSLGLFGVCTLPPPAETTVPPGTGGATTTTSTLPPSELAAAPRCSSAQLVVSALRFEAGLGNVAEVIGFENVGGALCTLTGYPGVAALNAQGVQVMQARRSLTAYLGGQDTGSAPMTVPLQPGQVVTATVDGSDNPVEGTSCPYYPALLVTAPDETHSVVLRGVGEQGPGFSTQGFPGCSPIVVTPVVPGDTGAYP